MVTRIDQVLVALLLLCSSVAASPADSLDSLTKRYEAARAKVLRQRGGGVKNAARKQLAPLLSSIARVKSDASRAYLGREITHTNAHVASVAAIAAIDAGGPEEAVLVFQRFARLRPQARKLVAEAISRPKSRVPAEAADALVAVFSRERDVEIQSLLAAAVGRLGSVRAAKALAAAARPVPARASTAGDEARALNAAIVAALSADEVEAVRRWLAGDALKERSTPALAAAIAAVGRARVEAAREHLSELLRDRRGEIAVAACLALAELGVRDDDVSALVDVARRAREIDTGSLAALLDALAASGDASALEFVLERARRGDEDTRTIAAGSLALSKSPLALQGLLGALADDSPQLRTAALRSLRSFRAKGMVRPLIDHIERETSERLRIETLELLLALTGKNMGFVVEDWRKWWEVAAPAFELAKPTSARTSVVAHDLEYFGIEVKSKRIAFLVDASNSMLGPLAGKQGGKRGKRDPRGAPGTKLDAMKKELTRIISALPPDTMINIVYFHRSYFPWKKRLASLRGPARAEAVKFVQDLSCALLTNIYDTLEFTLADRTVDTIYLLSDGQPVGGKFTRPADIIREVNAINRLRGVTINTICFGRETELLTKLARESGGESTVIGGPNRKQPNK